MFSMIKSIFKKIKTKYSIMQNPIKAARNMGVDIGEGCRLVTFPDFGSEPYLVSIGNHVTISNQVAFITHDGSTWCFRDQDKYRRVLRFGSIRIEDNCFIGYRAVLLPGVTIGPNSIVGACSLVTKNVPPNTVWGGYRLDTYVPLMSLLKNV